MRDRSPQIHLEGERGTTLVSAHQLGLATPGQDGAGRTPSTFAGLPG